MENQVEKETMNRPSQSLVISAIVIFCIISISLFCHFMILKQVSSLKLDQELWEGKKTGLANIITEEKFELAEIRKAISGHKPQIGANSEELQKLLGMINAKKNELKNIELQKNENERILQKALAERDTAEKEKNDILKKIGEQKALLDSNSGIVVEISKNQENLKSSKLLLEDLNSKLSKAKAEISLLSEEVTSAL